MQPAKILLGVAFVGIVVGAGYLYLSSSSEHQVNNEEMVISTEEEFEVYSPPISIVTKQSNLKAVLSGVDIEPVEESSWVSEPINEFSTELYEFIEAEGLKYVNTTNYPFDSETESELARISKSGDILLFDNTEPEYLNSISVSHMDIVSDYFGTASEGDALIASGIEGPDGGIHYLVLPISNKGDNQVFVDDVKAAVILFKSEREKLTETSSNEPTASTNP
jgi:hypothetical protein